VLVSWVSAPYFFQLVEFGIVLIILCFAFWRPAFGSAHFERLEQILNGLAAQRRLAVLLVVCAELLGRLVLLPLVPTPRPAVHDEFSYLLAGETFAAGRLANPPHPLWPHFESVHILQQPTYMSMYPPAQGLVLAAGQVLGRTPWMGVLLSVALMCGLICWMLQGWLPRSWALFGGLLVVVRWGLFTYWINGYWGGAVAASGAALVLGSLPRLLRRRRARYAVTYAVGIAVLINSRPFEGLVVSVAATVLFLAWSCQRSWHKRLTRSRYLAAVALVLSLVAPAMLFYNWRVTGSLFRLPYVVDREQYAIAPIFIWQQLGDDKRYRSESLRRVYVAEAELYRKARAAFGVPEMIRKLKNIWIFFGGPLLTIPLLFFLLRWRLFHSAITKFFGWLLVILLLTLFSIIWFYPHYAAPGFAALIAFLLQCMRQLRQWRWRGKPTGLFIVRAIPLACLFMAVLLAGAYGLKVPLSYWPLQWRGGVPAPVQAPALLARMTANGKKALVFVRYGPNHDVGSEWVYNGPDIDRQSVVWARETDPISDAALARYFADRNIWVLQPDAQPWELRPYASPSRKQISAPAERGGIISHGGLIRPE